MKSGTARPLIALFAASLILWANGCKKETKAPPPAPAVATPTVTINNHTWSVELAMTAQQQHKGLSGRVYLPADKGMLFVFPESKVRSFVMRGCYIPLDIAFIDADGYVIKTATMAVEDDLAGKKLYSSEKPAQFALEAPAGTMAAANVKSGSQVIFSQDIPLPTRAP